MAARVKKPETAAYQRIYDLLEHAKPEHADAVVEVVDLLLQVGRDPALAIVKVLEGLEPDTRAHVKRWMESRFGIPMVPATETVVTREIHPETPASIDGRPPREIGRQATPQQAD